MVLLTGRITLPAGVHREASRALKPGLTFGPSEQLQKRKTVSRGPVAQAATFGQRASTPCEFTRSDEQVVDARISEIRQGIHNSWCTVTVLDKEGSPARAVLSLGLGPVDELSVVNGSGAQCPLNAGTPIPLLLRREEGPSLNGGQQIPGETVYRAEMRREVAAYLLLPNQAVGVDARPQLRP